MIALGWEWMNNMNELLKILDESTNLDEFKEALIEFDRLQQENTATLNELYKLQDEVNIEIGERYDLNEHNNINKYYIKLGMMMAGKWDE